MSKSYERGGMYDQERNNEIANSILDYIDTIENLCILEGRKEKDVKKAIKFLKKKMKKLKNGHPEEVFDPERFDEFFNGK